MQNDKQISNIPTLYTAYNTVAKRIDFVIGQSDLPKFMQGTAGYEVLGDADHAPAYVKTGNAAVGQLIKGDFSNAASLYGKAWGEAAIDPQYWMLVLANAAGGSIAKETVLASQEARAALAIERIINEGNASIIPIIETVENTPHIQLLDVKTGTETKTLFISDEQARQNQWIVKTNGYTGQILGAVDDPVAAIENIVNNGFEQKGTNTNLWNHKYDDGIPQLPDGGGSIYRGVSGDPDLALKYFKANGDPGTYFVRFKTIGQEGYNNPFLNGGIYGTWPWLQRGFGLGPRTNNISGEWQGFAPCSCNCFAARFWYEH